MPLTVTELPPTSVSGEPVSPGHFGIAIRAMTFAMLAGTGLIALAMWLRRTLELQGVGEQGPVTGGPIFALVLGGTIGGFLLTIGLSWSLMRALHSPYRRGGLAIVAGFATVVVMLLTIVADQVAGRWGLLGFAGLCALGCLLLARRVAHGFRA
jgi:hypothetical protein